MYGIAGIQLAQAYERAQAQPGTVQVPVEHHAAPALTGASAMSPPPDARRVVGHEQLPVGCYRDRHHTSSDVQARELQPDRRGGPPAVGRVLRPPGTPTSAAATGVGGAVYGTVPRSRAGSASSRAAPSPQRAKPDTAKPAPAQIGRGPDGVCRDTMVVSRV